MVSTDSVSAASSASVPGPASLSAPASGHRPKAKSPKKQRRPSLKQLTAALNHVLGKDGKLMKDTLLAGRIFGDEKLDKSIVDRMMESMPKEYPWKPTVPPCLAGWIPTQTDT